MSSILTVRYVYTNISERFLDAAFVYVCPHHSEAIVPKLAVIELKSAYSIFTKPHHLLSIILCVFALLVRHKIMSLCITNDSQKRGRHV